MKDEAAPVAVVEELKRELRTIFQKLSSEGVGDRALLEELHALTLSHETTLHGDKRTRHMGILDRLEAADQSRERFRREVQAGFERVHGEWAKSREEVRNEMKGEIGRVEKTWKEELGEVHQEVKKLNLAVAALQEVERDRQRTLKGILIGLGLTGITGAGTLITLVSQLFGKG